MNNIGQVTLTQTNYYEKLENGQEYLTLLMSDRMFHSCSLLFLFRFFFFFAFCAASLSFHLQPCHVRATAIYFLAK